MNIDLELALRVTEVKRWTIVKLSRDQSLADHSYRVWLIARAIYKAMMPIPHNSGDAHLLEELALTHDLHEVLTGDFPATMKTVHPTAIKTLEDVARTKMGLASTAAHDGTLVAHIIKIADLAEALLFLYQNGGYRDRMAVWERVRGAYGRAFSPAALLKVQIGDWPVAHGVVQSMAASDPGWVTALGGIP